MFMTSWMLIAIPEHEKLSESYSLNQEYEGQNQIVDNVYGELSEPFLLRDSLTQQVIEKNGDELTILSSVSSKRADTNEKLFHVQNTFTVNEKTRIHTDREEKLFEFPPNVMQKDYDFFHPAIFFDDPMEFVRIDTISGLEVYVFETITTGSDISYAFSQFAPHVIFTDTTSELWVEPVTGNVVRFEKTWENYLIEDGQRINTIEIGGKKTTPFTEQILVNDAKTQIENNYYFKTVIPSLGISVIGTLGFIWILSTYLAGIRLEKNQLQNKEKLKDEVISMVSHEIKNPLTPILMSCDILMSEKHGSLNEEQLKKIQMIKKNTNNLKDLLSNFMETKKIDLDQVSLVKTQTDLKKYLENVIESVRPFTGKKHIKLWLSVDDSWKITIDQKRISQVISNLVKNAIDFVPDENGEIIVSAQKDDKGTTISVQDNGIGIPDESSDAIFDRFKQLVPPVYIQHEGSGLGLSVCKGIVESHGGRIWVDKFYKDGARFQFFIPN